MPIRLVVQYRDDVVKSIGEKLIVRKVEDTIKAKKLQDAKGKFPSRNGLQTYTLLDVITLIINILINLLFFSQKMFVR